MALDQMTDPVTDGSLGTGEEVIDDRNFVSQEHEMVDKVRSDETSTASNQDTLALRRGQEFDGWEMQQGSIRDRMSVWVEDGFGLVGCKPLSKLCV